MASLQTTSSDETTGTGNPAIHEIESSCGETVVPDKGGNGKKKRPSHKGVDFKTMTKSQLGQRLLQKGGIMRDLHEIAGEIRIRGHGSMRKSELVRRLVTKSTSNNGFLDRLRVLAS